MMSNELLNSKEFDKNDQKKEEGNLSNHSKRKNSNAKGQ